MRCRGDRCEVSTGCAMMLYLLDCPVLCYSGLRSATLFRNQHFRVPPYLEVVHAGLAVRMPLSNSLETTPPLLNTNEPTSHFATSSPFIKRAEYPMPYSPRVAPTARPLLSLHRLAMGLFDNARTPHEHRLQAAAKTGDVPSMEVGLQEWRNDSSISPPEASDLHLAAGIAVSNNQPKALGYLLDQGSSADNNLARQAAGREGTQCLDVLYAHGWRPESEPDGTAMPTIQ